MAIQTQVRTALIYGAETTFGTAATAGGTAKVLRRQTSSLTLGKDVFSSQEARPDLQLADVRHGTKRPAGAIQGELSPQTYDDLIQATLRGTWTAGAQSLAADYTTIAAAVTTGVALAPLSTGTFTWTAGDPVAKGHRVGDIIRTVGMTGSDNTNFRITGFSGTSNRIIAVTPAPAVLAATAATSFTTKGFKLQNGLVSRSFTIEQQYPDIAVSDQYTGMRCGSFGLNVPPTGMATCSFNFMGQNMVQLSGGASPYFTSPTPANTNGLMAGPNGSVRFAGTEQGILTSFSLNYDNSLQADPVIGSTLVPDIYYGAQKVMGSVSFFLQDTSLVNVFINETEVDIACTLVTSAAALPDFLSMNLQRVKTTGLTRSVAAQGGVLVTCPFQGLLANGVALGTDAVTLTMQKSI